MRKAGQEAIDVARAISGFLCDFAPMHKTGSEHTLRSYRCAIALYMEYLEKEAGVTAAGLSWEHFRKPLVEGWLAWLAAARGNSAATRNVRLGALRAFLEYAASRSPAAMCAHQESTTIGRAKCPKRKVEGMTKEAVKALLLAPDTSTRTGRRDLALMETLYATATRIDEALSLTLGNVHLGRKRPCIDVVGKGKKARTLYLPKRAASCLKAYMAEFHPGERGDSDLFFYARHSAGDTKLTQTAVRKRLRLHAARAHEACPDVPLGLHAHQFRHARASHWLDEGMDVVKISFLLGHEQLQTTMVYLDISPESVLGAVESLQDDYGKGIRPKWPTDGESLAGFCGL